jgi:hypothetical protein
VQERLGHATVVLTSDRYGHLFPRGDEGSELAVAEQALLGLNATRPRHAAEAGTTCSPLPAAVSAPSTTSRRQVKSWFGATPCRRATKLTVMPGSNVSSTIRTFSDAVQRRRR